MVRLGPEAPSLPPVSPLRGKRRALPVAGAAPKRRQSLQTKDEDSVEQSDKQTWAERFAARLRTHWVRLSADEALDEGHRLYALLSQEMSAETAADVIAAQWGEAVVRPAGSLGADAREAPPAPRGPAGLVIVEDDQTLCDVLRMALEGEGYAVWAATNAIEGLALIARNQPDALLTDLNMHGMDGAELVRVARDYSERPMTVVMMTGAVAQKDVQRARSAGADHLLLKPLEIDALVKVLPAARR